MQTEIHDLGHGVTLVVSDDGPLLELASSDGKRVLFRPQSVLKEYGSIMQGAAICWAQDRMVEREQRQDRLRPNKQVENARY